MRRCLPTIPGLRQRLIRRLRQSRLLERPELTSGMGIKDMLTALEDHERLVSMLDRTMAANHVQVFLGGELGETAGAGTMSLVAAPFRSSDGETAGAVGVLGPARMDYPVVVPLVGATAEAVGAVLTRVESFDPKGRSHPGR